MRGAELQRVPSPTAERLGITGGAGVLTRFASFWQPTWPAKRSWLVDGILLCGVLPESAPFAEKPDPSRSIRKQMIEVTTSAECQGCHRRINEPGFAFLKFDTFGRFVDNDAGEPADASGRLPAEVLPDRPSFNDQPSLARLLAERPEAGACLAQAIVQFAIAPRRIPHPRTPPAEAATSIAAVRSAFEAAHGNLRGLFLAVVETEAFLTGTPPVWE